MVQLSHTLIAASALVSMIFDSVLTPDGRTGHVTQKGTPLAQIETPAQAVAFANIQNLAARWNTIITQAKTGEDQLKLMRESGVFSTDFTITFVLPDGTKLAFDSLETEEVKAFYNQVVNGLKVGRANVASNVEVTSFGAKQVNARFRYVVFMGDKYSLGGVNEITVEKRSSRYQIIRSVIFVEQFDTDHAR